MPVQEVKYGLEEFDDKLKQSFWYLLKSPFINIKRITKQNDDKLHVTTMETKSANVK